jgi:hypothetical protein
MQDDSVMMVFNTPQFSGAQGDRLRHLHLGCHRPRAWHERHHLSALETVDERATPTRKEVVNRRLRG